MAAHNWPNARSVAVVVFKGRRLIVEFTAVEPDAASPSWSSADHTFIDAATDEVLYPSAEDADRIAFLVNETHDFLAEFQ